MPQPRWTWQHLPTLWHWKSNIPSEHTSTKPPTKSLCFGNSCNVWVFRDAWGKLQGYVGVFLEKVFRHTYDTPNMAAWRSKAQSAQRLQKCKRWKNCRVSGHDSTPSQTIHKHFGQITSKYHEFAACLIPEQGNSMSPGGSQENFTLCILLYYSYINKCLPFLSFLGMCLKPYGTTNSFTPRPSFSPSMHS